MYPNIIRKRKLFPSHLGVKWNEAYVSNIPKRLEAKRLYKETKEKKYDNFQECFKLIMNGNFGRLIDRHDFQYDPFCGMQVTIGGQIDIFMLVEDLEMAGIHVISLNTDGVTVYMKRSMLDKYHQICKAWEVEVGNDVLGNLEYVEYKLFVQTSVNDYIAVKADGSVKKKGDFLTTYELHKNKSKSIIPIAIEKYFVDGIPVADTIRAHKDIFSFCIAKKASKDYFYRSIDRKTGKATDLNKLVRYYCSKEVGEKLYKIKNPNSDKTGPVQSNCESTSELQVLFNRPFKLNNWDDYHIDYKYYEDACYKLIDQIQPEVARDRKMQEKGQISLF